MTTRTRPLIAPLLVAGTFLSGLSGGGLLVGSAHATTAWGGADTTPARFAAHMGVAYGVFRHWATLPYQRGYFALGQPDRPARLGRAAAALLATERDLGAALIIARRDPALRPLAPLVGGMANGYQALAATFRSGTVSAIGMRGTIGLTLHTEAAQHKLGVPVRETNPVPGSPF